MLDATTLIQPSGRPFSGGLGVSPMFSVRGRTPATLDATTLIPPSRRPFSGGLGVSPMFNT